MASLKRHEGRLSLDDRVSGGALVEAATYTCAHCQRQVILNPQRTRPRAYCGKCDHVVCDWCDGGACRPFRQRLDQLHTAAVRSLGKG